MRRFLAGLRRRFGLWRCSRGKHLEPLEWLRARERPAPITNQPLEMLHASGFMALAEWNGWCRRCGRAPMWSTENPMRPKRRDREVQRLLRSANRGAGRHARRA